MSDQDPPNPKEEESPEEETPPPMEAEASSESEGEGATEDAGGSAGEDSTEAAPEQEDDVLAGKTSNVLERGQMSGSDEKTMGMLAHLLGGITSIVGPLVIWAIKKDESPFVNDQGKEAMNFQITVLIAYVVVGILGALTGGCASVILGPVVGVVSLIFAILGGLEANKGIIYRYPFALRLIS